MCVILGRRALLLGAGASLLSRQLLANQPYVVPAGNALGFEVIREGCVIGTHKLIFQTPDADSLVVNVAVDLAVGIGPIKLFRYRHRAVETWKNGEVVSVETETDDDGKPFKVSASRDSSGLVVQGSKIERYVAPENALPATHWNRRMLDGPLINTQSGSLMRPIVKAVGPDLIPTAEGRQIEAVHFALNGDASLDTWYDNTPAWAGIMFKAGDGSEVRYERI